MKKSKLIFVSLVAIITFVFVGFNFSSSANAKTKNIVSYPKSMRGTWYNYSGKSQETKLVITAKKLTASVYVNGKYKKAISYKYTIRKPLTNKEIKHALKINKPNMYVNDVSASYTSYNSYKWLELKPLVINGFSELIFDMVHKFNGHTVFTETVNFAATKHYYKSQKLAKQLQHKKYPHMRYDNNVQQ